MKNILKIIAAVCRVGLGLLGPGLAIAKAAPEREARLPNVIVVLTDDQGWGDVGCYGSKTIRTPHLDRMAREGMRFTNFYAQPICSASRAALLTGSYPLRCGAPDVHSYGSPFGLSPDEITIAELLKTRGYATACVGKWHLGEELALGPNRQGFDYYYGSRLVNGTQLFETFAMPMWRNEQLLTPRPAHDRTTQDFFMEGMAFIERNRDRPFFLYLTPFMPHVPIYPGAAFRRRSSAGLFADAVEEIDHYMGRLFARLAELKLDENTLVIFTSDNGPWAGHGEQSGSAGGLRGAKLSTWEGGVRVPFIARWPGRIPEQSVSDEPAANIDLLPTIAGLAGAAVPSDRVIDGRDFWPVLAGERNARSQREAFYFYAGSWLQAVRADRWKLHLARNAREGIPGWCSGWFIKGTTPMASPELYDLVADPGETRNVAANHPEIVARLEKLAQGAREDIGDYGLKGANARRMGTGNPQYSDPSDWLRTPEGRAVTQKMVTEMRAFQLERYHVLQARPPVDAQDKAELEFYLQRVFPSKPARPRPQASQNH